MSTLFVNNLNTASGTDITIPTGKKLVVTDTGGIKLPGAVVQMQNATLAGGGNSTTSTSFVDTGLTVNITPKFATSKIFVSSIQAVQITVSTNGRVDYRCVENGSSTEVYRLDYIGHDGNAVTNFQNNFAGSGVFQCSNTNQLTFKTQVRKGGTFANEATTIYYDWYTNSKLTITAMEIAQ